MRVEHQGRPFAVARYLYLGELDYTKYPPSGIPPMEEAHLDANENFIFWASGGMVSSDMAISDAEEWGGAPHDPSRRRRRRRRQTAQNDQEEEQEQPTNPSYDELVQRVKTLESQLVEQEARLKALENLLLLKNN